MDIGTLGTDFASRLPKDAGHGHLDSNVSTVTFEVGGVVSEADLEKWLETILWEHVYVFGDEEESADKDDSVRVKPVDMFLPL